MSAGRKFKRCVTIVGVFILASLLFIVDRGIPNPQEKRCSFPVLTSTAQYKQYISSKQTTCENWAQLGGWLAAPKDGRKLMCLDERFDIQAGKCVVLSFGVNNEWSFEDDAEKLGCKVYAFDPTMGKEDHQRTPNIQFFKLGISDVEGEKKIGMNPVVTDFNFHKSFPVDRYENIVRRLGLEGRVIDYVKMDIELSELDVLRDLLDNSPHFLRNINQLSIEIPRRLSTRIELMSVWLRSARDFGPNSTVRKFWPLYHRLRCHGFSIMNYQASVLWREVVWGRDAAGIP
ncbi:uncharacterized protein LOC119578633 [Penaeus monodon]|uniref:uncharacterized protein LOC119578633 n=1 Tax=Penaeus monodon TaxID=6687 RepID=UPI0018A7C7D6|nr:uncharacterized protein LOC119578633 [Penaeus monodon]